MSIQDDKHIFDFLCDLFCGIAAGTALFFVIATGLLVVAVWGLT